MGVIIMPLPHFSKERAQNTHCIRGSKSPRTGLGTAASLKKISLQNSHLTLWKGPRAGLYAVAKRKIHFSGDFLRISEEKMPGLIIASELESVLTNSGECRRFVN
jgi:hypothetical protein